MRPEVTAGNRHSIVVYVECPLCKCPFAIGQAQYRGKQPIRCPKVFNLERACGYEETHDLTRTDDSSDRRRP